MADPFWRLGPGGLSLHLRVTPKSGRDRIEGVEQRDDGTTVLRLRVAAVPDRGKANAAVLALLAKSLGVPKTSLSLTQGDTSRFKTVLSAGAGAEMVERVVRLGLQGAGATQG